MYQHHGMQTELLMKPLHSSGQDGQKEVLYDYFSHVTPLALALASSMEPLHSLGQDS